MGLHELLTEKEKKINVAEEFLIEMEKYNLAYRFEEEKDLCSELKQLYVACTRARKRLILFD